MLVNVASDTIGILHVCGGDPTENQNLETTVKYSPRMWR